LCLPSFSAPFLLGVSKGLSTPRLIFNKNVGCSDGTREGFLDVSSYPNIAGCGGAWTVPGISRFHPAVAPACPNLKPEDTSKPRCGRLGGNQGTNSKGSGCTVEDICSVGWHVCLDYQDVNLNTQNKGCQDTGSNVVGDYLFLSRQSSNGCGNCAEGTSVGSECNSVSCSLGCLQSESVSNDVFGCGNYGSSVTGGYNCPPFNYFSYNLCSSIKTTSSGASTGWFCAPPEDPIGYCETYTIVNSNPSNGGVLCCKDANCPDTDGDGVSDCTDNCIAVPNPDQRDCDGDGTGSACDPCPKNALIDNSNYAGHC